MSLNPLLRPDASEAFRPRPGGRHIFDVQGKVLSACPAWGVGCSRTWPCSTARSHPAFVGLRRAEWCVYAARAMRTVCCSCLYHERSRHALRRCAAPTTGCQPVSAMNNNRSTVHKRQRPTCLSLCCCCFGRVFNSVFVHSCDANAAVTETNWWRDTWESRLPATPPHLLCLTQEKLF